MNERRDYLKFKLVDEQHGQNRKRTVQIDPEDIVAVGAVLIALILAAAMIFGAIPINKQTTAIVGLTGSGAVVASIVKARRGNKSRSPWPERVGWLLIILMLAAAFGIYVWL